MKYGLLNVLLGLAMAWMARPLGLPGLPLVWLGLGFAVLGTAYLTRRPGLLGKRPDGTVAACSWLLLLPLHGILHGVWQLCRVLLAEPAVCQVTPRLWVGRRLLAREMPPEVKCVVDLTAEFPEPDGVRHGRSYRWFPMLDATAPNPQALNVFLKSLPDVPTLIHCAQGHGRTGLVAMAWLLQKGACATWRKAEDMVRSVRPGIRLNAEQRRFTEHNT